MLVSVIGYNRLNETANQFLTDYTYYGVVDFKLFLEFNNAC
jgi:hypothetical protein